MNTYLLSMIRDDLFCRARLRNANECKSSDRIQGHCTAYQLFLPASLLWSRSLLKLPIVFLSPPTVSHLLPMCTRHMLGLWIESMYSMICLKIHYNTYVIQFSFPELMGFQIVCLVSVASIHIFLPLWSLCLMTSLIFIFMKLPFVVLFFQRI